MNVNTNYHRWGWALICVGMGIHLVILELVRLGNSYATKFSTDITGIYLLSCLACSMIIATGIILLTVRWTGIVPALILGIVSFCLGAVCLFYSAYFISDGEFQMNWLLVSVICFVGISLVVLGGFNLIKRR
jgi:hypothetical protein